MQRQRPHRILIVEQDAQWCARLRRQLHADLGLGEVDEVHAYDCDTIAQRVDSFQPDLVLLDIHGKLKGAVAEAWEQFEGATRHVAVALISADDQDEESVARGLERGALGYVRKTGGARLCAQQIRIWLEQVAGGGSGPRPGGGGGSGPRPGGGGADDRGFMTVSTLVRDAIERLRRLFRMGANPILIVGESGSGKEALLREALDGEPIMSVNSAAIDDVLAESLLFGHVKGAFTSAHCGKKGFFEAARGKVLFLDEVGDMSLGVQAKLLRAIEEGKVLPLGGTVPVDVSKTRLILATHADLEQRVSEGSFREDLLHRVKWDVRVENPPLRRRPADIELLARDHVARVNARLGRAVSMDPPAWEQIRSFRWPGNVRQLFSFVDGLFVSCDDRVTAAAVRERLQTTYGYSSPHELRVPQGAAFPPRDRIFTAADERVAMEVFRSKRFALQDVADAVRAEPSLRSNPYLDPWRNNLSIKLRRMFLKALVECELDLDAATAAILGHLAGDAQLAQRIRAKLTEFVAQQSLALGCDSDQAHEALRDAMGKRLAEAVERFFELLTRPLAVSRRTPSPDGRARRLRCHVRPHSLERFA